MTHGKLNDELTGNPVTQWLTELKGGNGDAAEPLWNHFRLRLTGLARVRLNDRVRRVFDENDLASVAFQGFLKAAMAGGCDQVQNRDDLWRLLAVITANRANDSLDADRTVKRGGGNVRGESVFAPASLSKIKENHGIDNVLDKEATPDLLMDLMEQAQNFLDDLPEETLRTTALYKLQGYENSEIAEKLSLSVRSVERKISLIRRLWSAAAADGGPPAP